MVENKTRLWFAFFDDPERMNSMGMKISVRPRFWILLIVVFLTVFIPLYCILGNRLNDLEKTEARLMAEKASLDAQVTQLKADLDFARSEAGIERYARAQGMIMPGEIKYNIIGQ